MRLTYIKFLGLIRCITLFFVCGPHSLFIAPPMLCGALARNENKKDALITWAKYDPPGEEVPRRSSWARSCCYAQPLVSLVP